MSNQTSTTSSTKNNGKTKPAEQAAKPAETLPAPPPETTTAAETTAAQAEAGRTGRKPKAEMTPDEVKRHDALHLSWPKVARFDGLGRVDITATNAAFAEALAIYIPFAHVASTKGPKSYLDVEVAKKLAEVARGAFDKFSKPTPDFGRVMKLSQFIDGCYSALGFDSFADDAEAKKDSILDTLTDKLGYERVKVASKKRPGTLEVSSGANAMIARSKV